MRWVPVNTLSWNRQDNQPKFHMDGEAWKGGRRLSRTDRQWWTAALGNLDQVDSRTGAKKKKSRENKKKTQHHWIQTMHLTREVIFRASNRRLASQPLHCVQISQWRKLSPCAKRMEVNSRLRRALFSSLSTSYLGGAGRGLQNLEVFWWAPSQTRTSAGNWVERGAAIFVKNPEWVRSLCKKHEVRSPRGKRKQNFFPFPA